MKTQLSLRRVSALLIMISSIYSRYDKFMAAFDHVSTKIDEIYKVTRLRPTEIHKDPREAKLIPKILIVGRQIPLLLYMVMLYA